MEEEYGSTIVTIAVVFFERYNLAEIAFFYLLLQILLFAKFQRQDYFIMGGDLSHAIKGQTVGFLIFKPFLLVAILFLPMVFVCFYTFIAAWIFSIFIEQIPKISIIILNKQVSTPVFDLKRSILDGSILIFFTYLFCYAGTSDKVIDLKNQELSKLNDEKLYQINS